MRHESDAAALAAACLKVWGRRLENLAASWADSLVESFRPASHEQNGV